MWSSCLTHADLAGFGPRGRPQDSGVSFYRCNPGGQLKGPADFAKGLGLSSSGVVQEAAIHSPLLGGCLPPMPPKLQSYHSCLISHYFPTSNFQSGQYRRCLLNSPSQPQRMPVLCCSPSGEHLHSSSPRTSPAPRVYHPSICAEHVRTGLGSESKEGLLESPRVRQCGGERELDGARSLDFPKAYKQVV